MEINVRNYCLCCLIAEDLVTHYTRNDIIYWDNWKINILFVNFLTKFCYVPQMQSEDEIKNI